jgi:hypothetical protein
VLFGGETAEGYSDETWEWDGTAWAQRAAAGPAARAYHTLTYDSARQVTVLFGGRTAGGLSAETWEWNGIVWVQRLAAGPSAREFHSAVYDEATAKTVVFGGQDITGYTQGTWEWDGNSWSQRPGAGPGLRSGAAMAYDSARAMVILHGGFDASYSPETWELASGTPTISQQPSSTSAAAGQSAQFTVHAAGVSTYRWRKNGTPLSDGGKIAGSGTGVLTINQLAAGDAGAYSVEVSNGCGSLVSEEAVLTVGSVCYANCDGSIVQPILNVNDFVCFLGKYAAQDPYANCDGSTAPPVLNVNDFICFQTRYAAGCP